MSYIMVVNNAKWNLHGALSWNNIQQQCFNDLQPGQSHDFVVGLGWHDLTIVPGTPTNRFDSNKNNVIDWGRLALQSLALVTTGMGNPSMMLMANRTSAGTGLWTLGVGPAGTGTGDIKVIDPGIKVHPVQVEGLYAPDGYTVTMSGNDVSGTFDEASNTFTITKISPLVLHWANRTSGKSGNVTAAT